MAASCKDMLLMAAVLRLMVLARRLQTQHTPVNKSCCAAAAAAAASCFGCDATGWST
jgi:hypothetical protein